MPFYILFSVFFYLISFFYYLFQPSESVDICLLLNLGSFQLFKYFLASDNMDISSLILAPQIPEALFMFFFSQSMSSLLFRLDNFYWSILNFINSFLYHLHSAVSIQWVFNFCYSIFFNFKISIGSWSTLSLLSLSIFPFVSRMFKITCSIINLFTLYNRHLEVRIFLWLIKLLVNTIAERKLVFWLGLESHIWVSEQLASLSQ